MKRPSPEEFALTTDRLVLRMPGAAEANRLQAFQVANREVYAEFNAPYASGFFTVPYWEKRLEEQRADYLADQTCCLTFFMAGDDEGPAVGTCNFTKFVRGRFQACYLGYTLTHEKQGQGLMGEAIRAGLGFVFGDLAMHRVMANYLPDNERSARVLERLGFVKEGYAKDYLFINGRWQDHVLTALTNPNPTDPAL